MRTFQIPAQIVGVSTKADRSLSIRINTDKEMMPEETTLLMSYVRRSGWFLFRENEFKDEDAPVGDAPTGQKSVTQRLRSVLFVLYKQEHPDKPESGFQQYYEDKVERIIGKIKERLD